MERTLRKAYQRREKLLDGLETAFREMSSGKNSSLFSKVAVANSAKKLLKK